MLFVPAVSRTKAAPVIKNILNMVFLQTQYVKRPEWCQPEDGEIGELGRNWNEISQIGHVAGQKGGLRPPTIIARQAGVNHPS
jgi:hypothetical protein